MCEVSAARGATDLRNKQVLMVRHINVKPMKKPNLSNDVFKKKKTAGAEMLKHTRKESASISHTEQQRRSHQLDPHDLIGSRGLFPSVGIHPPYHE